jgi:large subunit ribosomal protein L25
MATAQLSASPRTTVGKAPLAQLRSAGQIPAVIYGHAREPLSLAIPAREVEKLLERVSAESTVIELTLASGVSPHADSGDPAAPVQEADPSHRLPGAGGRVRRSPVNVPIVLTGTPDGVRLSGGILSQVMSELAIRVDPVNIPRRIEADVTHVVIGHSLHVSDLKVPEGVEILDEAGRHDRCRVGPEGRGGADACARGSGGWGGA